MAAKKGLPPSFLKNIKGKNGDMDADDKGKPAKAATKSTKKTSRKK